MQMNPTAPIEILLQEIGENLEKHTKKAGLDKQELAKLADLNRNTVGAALSGSDMKLSTLIRLTRVLGFTDWLLPLLDSLAQSPMEQLTKKGKSLGPKSYQSNKPASRVMGRQKGKS